MFCHHIQPTGCSQPGVAHAHRMGNLCAIWDTTHALLKHQSQWRALIGGAGMHNISQTRAIPLSLNCPSVPPCSTLHKHRQCLFPVPDDGMMRKYYSNPPTDLYGHMASWSGGCSRLATRTTCASMSTACQQRRRSKHTPTTTKAARRP